MPRYVLLSTPPPAPRATKTPPPAPSLRAPLPPPAAPQVPLPHDCVIISVSDRLSVRLYAHLVKQLCATRVNTCDGPPPVKQVRRKNNHVKKGKSPLLFRCPDCIRKFRADYGFLEHIIEKNILLESPPKTPTTVRASLIETMAHRGGAVLKGQRCLKPARQTCNNSNK